MDLGSGIYIYGTSRGKHQPWILGSETEISALRGSVLHSIDSRRIHRYIYSLLELRA
jgi:hypothetical protein